VSLVRDAWPGMVLAALGPLVLAAGSPGEYWWGDPALLLLLTSALALAITVPRRRLFPRLEPDRATALDLVLIGALTLPFLVLRDLHAAFPALPSPRIRVTLALTALVALGAGFAILRWPHPPTRLVRIIKVTVILLTLTSVVRMATAGLETRRHLATSPLVTTLRQWNADSAARTMAAGSRPDILLLILDAYAGDSLLESDYGMDRRPFRAALDSLGFTPVRRYSSNYARTFASVSSILNFAHVATIDSEPAGRSRSSGVLHGLITHNRTTRLLHQLGYDIQWVPGPLFAGRDLPPPEATVRRTNGPWSYRARLYSSLIETWVERVSTPGVAASALGYTLDLSPAVIDGVRLLPELARDGRPTFAVVHLMATHFPYMYLPDCTVSPARVQALPTATAYPAAVRCLDALLLPALRQVVRESGDNTIILAVGDHAPSSATFDESGLDAGEVPREVLEGHFNATAFFYVPPRMRDRFVPPASGVNLMPAVLTAAFRATLPQVLDTRYFSPARHGETHGFVDLGE
jgi:hypothetical protein